MKIYNISIDLLEKKIFSAYPANFSEKLKKDGGNYFPLGMSKAFTDSQIKDQIEMRTFGFQYSIDTVTEFLRNINGNWVIDLGCGYGVEALIMGELSENIKIYALDRDQEKISLLDSVLNEYTFKDGKRGKEKIILVEGDILNLPKFNQPFDGVFIKHVIAYVASCESPKYSYPDVYGAVKTAMKNIAEKVMNQVKEIAPNSWLTLRDGDTNEDTREPFMDGIQFALGPTKYRMLPVKRKIGEQIIKEKVLAIDRRIHKKTADSEGKKYKSPRRQEEMKAEEERKGSKERPLADPLL